MTDEKSRERQLSLLDALHARSREGRVNWMETEANNTNWFMAESGNFLLKIGEIFDPDYPESPDYALVITNATNGKEIERISNISLRPVSDRDTPEGLNPYTLLQQIHEMARRKALRVDDVLESLLENLKGS